MLIYIFFLLIHTFYLVTPRTNTNRYGHAHKYLHCAGIEPATSWVVREYSLRQVGRQNVDC
jgi:hypothetical protein